MGNLSTLTPHRSIVFVVLFSRRVGRNREGKEYSDFININRIKRKEPKGEERREQEG